jgi:hypothetical protein
MVDKVDRLHKREDPKYPGLVFVRLGKDPDSKYDSATSNAADAFQEMRRITKRINAQKPISLNANNNK